MNPPTKEQKLQALRDSIEHWKRIRDDPRCTEKPNSHYCACCNMCREWYEIIECESGCPIMEFTGVASCEETPYQQAWEAWLLKEYYPTKWKDAAQEEINFLEKCYDYTAQS